MTNTSKTAVVTGGSSGIGLSTVKRLLSEGWTVWSLDMKAPPEEQGSVRQARHLRCDVADPSSVKAAFDAIGAECRKLDALICSAGVIRVGRLEDYTPEQVDQVLGINVKGPWLCIRAALPMLRQDSTTDHPARIVLIGSIAAIRPKTGAAFYGASKAALHLMAGVFAAELAPTGVIVNVVAPGSVDTPMMQSMSTTSYRTSSDSPLGRIAQPDDVTDVIMYFLGDASKYVNGTVLPVDGGSRAAFVPR